MEHCKPYIKQEQGSYVLYNNYNGREAAAASIIPADAGRYIVCFDAKAKDPKKNVKLMLDFLRAVHKAYDADSSIRQACVKDCLNYGGDSYDIEPEGIYDNGHIDRLFQDRTALDLFFSTDLVPAMSIRSSIGDHSEGYLPMRFNHHSHRVLMVLDRYPAYELACLLTGLGAGELKPEQLNDAYGDLERISSIQDNNISGKGKAIRILEKTRISF